MKRRVLVILAAVLLLVGGGFWFASLTPDDREPVESTGASFSLPPAKPAPVALERRKPTMRQTRLEMGVSSGAGEALSPGDPHTREREGQALQTPSIAALLEPEVRGDPSEASPGSGLSIAGRVLDEEGNPVPGLGVVASGLALEESDASSSRERRVHASKDGSYEFVDVEAGDHLIRNVATDRYASTRVTARAGFQSADLIVVENHRIWLHGTITDTRGEPLADVQVIPPQSQSETSTDQGGNYVLNLVAQREGSYAFRFLLDGYTEERILLKGSDLIGLQENRFDVQLTSAADTTTVSGTLTTDRGEPIEGEMIRLQSALLQERYAAVTDRGGSFSIPDVKVGSDYSVRVLPEGPYGPYTELGVAFDERGALLEIVLEALGTGRLEGRMLDAEGDPLPGFSLWLQTSRNPANRLRVTAGDHGDFVVENAPEGQLLFITRSSPRLEVQGIELREGAEKEVDLVVDWGDHELAGSVLDDGGEPIAGAALTLTWSLDSGGIRSTSTRRTVTDESGSFRFTQLGPGLHDLDVSAAGYGDTWERLEPGPYARETEIRLEPNSQ